MGTKTAGGDTGSSPGVDAAVGVVVTPVVGAGGGASRQARSRSNVIKSNSREICRIAPIIVAQGRQCNAILQNRALRPTQQKARKGAGRAANPLSLKEKWNGVADGWLVREVDDRRLLVELLLFGRTLQGDSCLLYTSDAADE